MSSYKDCAVSPKFITDKFMADCKIYKMAEDLFVCETEGACQFSMRFADRKFCKNNIVIEQQKN